MLVQQPFLEVNQPAQSELGGCCKLVQPHKRCTAAHVAANIKNTITIFHHLRRACESTDKPWLHYYYFQSDRHTNIFCDADFHSICHNSLLWKTV